MQRWQSFCPGMCGFRASNVGYRWYWRERQGDGGREQQETADGASGMGAGGAAGTPRRDEERQLVCVMPGRLAERMVSFISSVWPIGLWIGFICML